MGLVEYGSDSEEEQQQQLHSPRREESIPATPLMKALWTPRISLKNTVEDLKDTPQPPHIRRKEVALRTQEVEEMGPIMGPSRPPRTPSPSPQTPNQGQLSPYSLNRATIRSLTFPTSIPDIPPSPPGDEPEEVAAKFDRFRQLKREGIHFNEKLQRSSALRNPNILEKLAAFVGLSEKDQYASNLPTEIWDPTGFPEDAFAGKLAKSQQEVLEKRQAERSQIDFVGVSAPTALSVGQEKKGAASAAQRVMAGLDRERKSKTPPVESSKRRDERKDDRKWDGRDKDRASDRWREDDQYRKRRRSRSRSRSRSREKERYRIYETRG